GQGDHVYRACRDEIARCLGKGLDLLLALSAGARASAAPRGAMRRRGRRARKYLVIMVSLVAGALLVSGGIEIYASYQENKDALVTLQREKAAGAAYKIEAYVREIERQLVWTTQPLLVPPAAAIEQRRVATARLARGRARPR